MTKTWLHGALGQPQAFLPKAAASGQVTTVWLHGTAGRRQSFVAKTPVAVTDLYLTFPPFEFGFAAAIAGSGFETTGGLRNRRLMRLLGGYRR